MTERLLQFIWQFQYFNKQQLSLPSGESFQILHPGTLNTNQGPDFLAARIRIGDATIVGPVELHIKTSLWYRHAHQHDGNYAKVILHVVWEEDLDSRDSPIPVLCLHDRVSKLLLQQYEDWMSNQWFIACSRQIAETAGITWIAWNERLLVERLQRKAGWVMDCLLQNNQHWEETFWWLLARNFGIPVNADVFEAMARSLSLTILGKHRNQPEQLEALLMGQAGLLGKVFTDAYPRRLQETYSFYQKAYKLPPPARGAAFLRMRPPSFPTIRLAQLAALLHKSGHLFSKIMELETMPEVAAFLDVAAGGYWEQHYTFDHISPVRSKPAGDGMIRNIIINSVVPMLFAYGYIRKEQALKDKALHWLSSLRAEENRVTRSFQQCGIAAGSAFESQALLELKHNYCDQKRCLDCAVGNALLKKNIASRERAS